MEENKAILKSPTNCGFTSGVLELYEDKLVFTSNKGKTIVYEYKDISKVSNSLGCLVLILFNGKSESFSLDKDTRQKMVDYVSNNISVPTEQTTNLNQQTVKEQFKNASNTVIDNVKSIDTEQVKQQTMNFANNVKTDVKNFKTINKQKQIIYIVIGIAIIFVIMKIFGGSYSTEEKALLENAEREIGYKISATCGNVPSSDIDYSVYKIDGSKCILKCKSSNSSVKKKYGTTFYAGCIQNANFSYTIYINEDVSQIKDYLDF